MLMNEAIQQFSRWRQLKVKTDTIKGYETHLKYLCLYLHNPNIEEITLDQIVNYQLEMKALGWHQNSFVQRACAFKKFFEFFRRQRYGVIDENLIEIPDTLQPISRIGDEMTYRKLMSIIPANTTDPRMIRNRAMISLYRYTGARNTEICRLKIADIDLTKRQGIIRTLKSHDPRPYRVVKWPEETNRYIEQWLVKRRHLQKVINNCEIEPLFISVCNQRSGKQITNKGVAEFFRQYSKRAGLPSTANAHSWRHLFVQDNLEVNSPFKVIKMTGHSSINSLQSYTKYRDKDIIDAWDTHLEALPVEGSGHVNA